MTQALSAADVNLRRVTDETARRRFGWPGPLLSNHVAYYASANEDGTCSLWSETHSGYVDWRGWCSPLMLKYGVEQPQ